MSQKIYNQIADEVAKESAEVGFSHLKYSCMAKRNFTKLEKAFKEIARRYARAIAEQALKNAAENAYAIVEQGDDPEDDGCLAYVDKQSILNEKNMLEI